jgi:hypothetical protein
MKKRILVLTTIMISIAFFTGVGILIATDIPEDMDLKSDVYETHKKGPVPFSHQKHSDSNIACTECHHTWKEGEPVKKCSECHDPLETKGEAKKLMLAYHNTCKKCHMDLKKAEKPTGPTMCNDCHKKE